MTESMAIPLYGLSHIKVTGSPAQWKVAEFKPGDKSFLLTMTQTSFTLSVFQLFYIIGTKLPVKQLLQAFWKLQIKYSESIIRKNMPENIARESIR